MKTIKAFIERHPLLSYVALTFAISWGGILIVAGPGGLLGTKEISEVLFPIAILATLAGPSVAGILLTGLVYGKAGFRDLLSRLLRWRVGVRWYAIALLTAPLTILAVLLALSLASPAFRPLLFVVDDPLGLLVFSVVAGSRLCQRFHHLLLSAKARVRSLCLDSSRSGPCNLEQNGPTA